MTYPNTFYAAEVDAGEPLAPLSKHLQADVCIIGGGLAGLTTGLELARRGLGVVLLEAERVGWGASGRNGGFVSAGFALESEKMFDAVGKDDAWTLFGLSVSGVQYVRNQIERLKLEDVLQGEGFYLVSRRKAREEMRNYVEFCGQNLGYDLKFCDVDEVRSVLETRRYYQAAFDKDAFHIQPLKYTLGLAHAFEWHGGFLFEQTRATSVKKDGTGWRVRSKDGSVSAAHIVFCTSAYDLSIYRPMTKAVLPVSTYVVATDPEAELLSGAIKTRASIADTRRAGDYYRRLPDGRLLWGGRISTKTSVPRNMGDLLLKDTYSVYKQLGSLKPAYVWSGTMGYARHMMPLIAQMQPGLWASTAFGGHGLNTTAMAGQLISRAIAEGDDQYKLFEPFGFKRAGGPLRRLGVQTSYWAMQARDKVDELF